MKTIYLLLLTIAWTGLMRGMVYAATSGDASPQTERAVTPHPSRQVGTPSPSGIPKDRAGVQGGKTTTLSSRASRERVGLQGGSERPPPPGPRGEGGPAFAGPGEGSFGTIKSKRVAQTPLSGSAVLTVPVRPPGAVRPAAATLRDVRHCGANPATVGGLGNRTVSNTGSIDGTRMHRRP
jgi:hypothetical protein